MSGSPRRILCLAAATALLAVPPVLAEEPMAPAADRTVFDFDTDAAPWSSIDDRVMGGVSRSRMQVEGGTARFEGTVSLDNNGGFASVRSAPAPHDLTGFEGILLRVRGDGKVYGIRLRTNDSFDGVSYQADIRPAADAWEEIRIPFRAFRPVFRGRTVPGHPPLDPAAIRTFGVIISEKQVGRFRLELDRIAAYGAP